MKVALVKYRTKKYGKWFPKNRQEFKEIQIDPDSEIDKLDQVKNKLQEEGIEAVEIEIHRTITE
jgi:hypothetical protein